MAIFGIERVGNHGGKHGGGCSPYTCNLYVFPLVYNVTNIKGLKHFLKLVEIK